ncbi:hypothetical protein AB0N73_11835 [Microbacterium sp. NPDC089189]|uniref:hypothetical protein n=1 Tax=Microbacterium sp. NPDC089189 TaxID=3154972 RepID=UPI00341C9224
MGSPSPTSSSLNVAQSVGHLLFETWLGQALVSGFVLACLGWLFHTWIAGFLRRCWAWVRDLRLTRKSTVVKEIEAAVETAEASMREKVDAHARAPTGRARQAGMADDEAALARDERRRAGEMKDQWTIHTNRAQEQRYILRNTNARSARRVRLDPPLPGSFEVIAGPVWDLIENGEHVAFQGRIADSSLFEALGRGLDVLWTDDHGDEQSARIVIDRNYNHLAWF